MGCIKKYCFQNTGIRGYCRDLCTCSIVRGVFHVLITLVKVCFRFKTTILITLHVFSYRSCVFICWCAPSWSSVGKSRGFDDLHGGINFLDSMDFGKWDAEFMHLLDWWINLICIVSNLISINFCNLESGFRQKGVWHLGQKGVWHLGCPPVETHHRSATVPMPSG